MTHEPHISYNRRMRQLYCNNPEMDSWNERMNKVL